MVAVSGAGAGAGVSAVGGVSVLVVAASGALRPSPPDIGPSRQSGAEIDQIIVQVRIPTLDAMGHGVAVA